MKNSYEDKNEKKGNVINSQLFRISRIASRINEENVYIEDEKGMKEFLTKPKESYIEAVKTLGDMISGYKDKKYADEINKINLWYKKKIKSPFVNKDKVRHNFYRRKLRIISNLISRSEGTDFGLTDENE